VYVRFNISVNAGFCSLYQFSLLISTVFKTHVLNKARIRIISVLILADHTRTSEMKHLERLHIPEQQRVNISKHLTRYKNG
jgi:hypothetical protein